MEASESLLQNLQSKSHNAHLHQNLTVYETKDRLSQFDAVVHGDIAEETFAIVLEAKTKVHPDDLRRVLEKAALFRSYLDFKGTLSCTSGFDPASSIMPFTHYRNVKHVLPCLAGRHFPSELIEECCKRDIIPVFPSGARYAVKMLNLVPRFIK